MPRPNDALLGRLRSAFEPMAGGPLTRDDAAEIAGNLHRFYQVLREWAIEDAKRGVGPWAGLDLAEEE